MKKLFYVLSMLTMVGLLASCGKKEEKPVVEPPQQEVYKPVHKSSAIDLKTAKRYDYRNAPMNAPATEVIVKYDEKTPYRPIVIGYVYANGDTYTYAISEEFGLWQNEAGKFRVLSDDNCTVWLQGQTKDGKLHEFVFYGDPKYNGTKITPNSYRNLPAGEIKYRK